MEGTLLPSPSTASRTEASPLPPISRPSSELAVLGAINWDTTLFVGDFAAPGEEIPVSRIEEGPGGKGANAAVAAARILGKGKVAFVGAVGDDELGSTLCDSLKVEGVSTEGVVRLRGQRSGTAHIVVDRSGSKAIHTHFGANDRLKPAHLAMPGPSLVLSSSSTVVVMDVPTGTALEAARIAKRAGVRLVYSPGVRCAEGYGALSKVLQLVDEAVFDRSELLKLRPSRSPREALHSIMGEIPTLAMVATLGPSGCLVGKEGSVDAVTPVSLESLGLKAVNSTGSGDAFLAAYVCYSNFGSGPKDAARWGNLAGALKATSDLTRGSPDRRVLESRMAELSTLTGKRRG